MKNFSFYSEILQKFNDFINFDDSIGKIPSNSIGLQPVFIRKNI